VNDGHIIDLAPEPDDYGTLPSHFRVIKQDHPEDEPTPLYYWHDAQFTNAYWHNSLVYFDPDDFETNFALERIYDVEYQFLPLENNDERVRAIDFTSDNINFTIRAYEPDDFKSKEEFLHAVNKSGWVELDMQNVVNPDRRSTTLLIRP
jgi:hypothetical protein